MMSRAHFLPILDACDADIPATDKAALVRDLAQSLDAASAAAMGDAGALAVWRASLPLGHADMRAKHAGAIRLVRDMAASMAAEPARPQATDVDQVTIRAWADQVRVAKFVASTGVKVLWRQPDTLTLWGIPYTMRRDIGQTPRHLWEASRAAPSAPWRLGAVKPLSLADWTNFGLGDAVVRALGDLVPDQPESWVDLTDLSAV